MRVHWLLLLNRFLLVRLWMFDRLQLDVLVLDGLDTCHVFHSFYGLECAIQEIGYDSNEDRCGRDIPEDCPSADSASWAFLVFSMTVQHSLKGIGIG